ncbi:DUF3592 domain-containing protein [Streptomyces sp. NPDC059072]|uniref:DUF3592 domain-containing protein n=1 Tax=Streptomyces sp. NPDC059072 TaxID=3346715 RepID=UPI00369E1544
MSASQVLWILALAFTLPGAVVGTAAYRKVRQIRTLLRRGARAQGVVTRLEATKLEGPGEGATITIRSSGTTVYSPVVAWTTADGQAMETSTNVARSLARTPAVGTRVEIRYDPTDPSRWTLPAEGSGFWRLGVALGGLFFVIGAGFLFGALYSRGA